MNPLVFAGAGVLLVAIGLTALVVVRHLLRRLLAVNMMASGIFLVLVGGGQRDAVADPVPQALVLTGIVVAFASTALALALLRRWYRATGQTVLDAPDTTAGSKAERGEAP